MILKAVLIVTKYFKYIYDNYHVLEAVCDDLKEYRKELAFLRKLKASCARSYNPIIEIDYGDDGLGFEFRRLHSANIVRVIYRSGD